MGQVIPLPLSYNNNNRVHHHADDSITALTLADTPLHWTRLDDTVMGGRSHTHLTRTTSLVAGVVPKAKTTNDNKDLSKVVPQPLSFQGTIDTAASVGFASIRAPLPPAALPANAQALRVTAAGDGLTYKVLLMDAKHGRWSNTVTNTATPLWEADVETRAGTNSSRLGHVHTWTIPLERFVPTYMGRPCTDKVFRPEQMTRIGFMLSSRLADGSPNHTYETQPAVFDFQLQVHDIQVVVLEKEQLKEYPLVRER